MNERIYYSEEAKQRARKDRQILALTFMFMGMGLGTVIAMLFAPQKGEDTRSQVYDIASDATSNAVETLQKNFENLRQEVEKKIG
jgi:gas vesicle protein